MKNKINNIYLKQQIYIIESHNSKYIIKTLCHKCKE